MTETIDYTILLGMEDDAEALGGTGPVVVVGPNGSGKTRKTREMGVSAPREFINALRNTRVSPQVPAMGLTDARNNFRGQRNQAQTSHWELASDFDFLLSQLLAENAIVATTYMEEVREGGGAELPPPTALTSVMQLWKEVFPGRRLTWKDWAPHVLNETGPTPTEYSGNQMSDGEKAALYLAGRVFSAAAGVVVVDEPETHLHSLLAIRLWDALEAARPDLRFVYVTHDLTFALSRPQAQYVLADPKDGLKALDLGSSLPGDVAEILLGAASMSFYARRVIFCEGTESGPDSGFYNAWFSGKDTVVRSVGSSETVLRCTGALAASGIASSLQSVGVIDRDFHPDEFIAAVAPAVHALLVHEYESLLCLPGVVAAVCLHLGRPFDEAEYLKALRATVTPEAQRMVVLERWKRRLEPRLEGLVSGVRAKSGTLDEILADLPQMFDHSRWPFSPDEMLRSEQTSVEKVLATGTSDQLLAIVPGKALVAVAARVVGQTTDAYRSLVTNALRSTPDSPLLTLHDALESVLRGQLPARSLG